MSRKVKGMLLRLGLSSIFLVISSTALQIQASDRVKGGQLVDVKWTRWPLVEYLDREFTIRLMQGGRSTGASRQVNAFGQEKGHESLQFPIQGGSYVIEVVRTGDQKLLAKQQVVVEQERPPPLPPNTTPTPANPIPNPTGPITQSSTRDSPNPTTTLASQTTGQPNSTPNSGSMPGSSGISSPSTANDAQEGNFNMHYSGEPVNIPSSVKVVITVEMTRTLTDSSGIPFKTVITATSASSLTPASTDPAAVNGGVSKNQTAIIIGAVLGSILALILLILLVICCRRRLRKGHTARFRRDLMVRRHWLTGAEKAALESPTSDVISEQSTGIISLSSESTQSLHFTDSSPSHSYYYKSNGHRGRDSIPFSEATAATTTTTPSTLRLPIEPKSSQHPMIVNTPATPPLPPPPARSGVMSFESSSTSSLSTFKAILPDHARDVGRRIADLEDQKRRLGSEMEDSLLVRTIDEQIVILRDIR